MSDFIKQFINTNNTNDFTNLQNGCRLGNTIDFELDTNTRNYFTGSPDDQVKALSDYTELYCTNRTMDDSSQDDDEDLDKDSVHCRICGEDFDTKAQFGAHNPYKCLINNKGMDCLSCGNHFNTYDEYENDHNPDICLLKKTMYACNSCWTEFKIYEELDEHDSDKCWTNNHPILDCSSCGKHFETESELCEHCPNNCWYNNVDFDCTCCGAHFDTQAELCEHDENKCWDKYEEQNPDKCWTLDNTKFDCTCCKMHLETYTELLNHDEKLCWTAFANNYLAKATDSERYLRMGKETIEEEFEDKMAELDEKYANLEREYLEKDYQK
jgi:hypothetical protein